MLGVDGLENKNLIKVTWEQFQKWQRWDEFPERNDDPPMTVDMSFVYKDKLYYLDRINQKYTILTYEWKAIAEDENFINLLNTSIDEWASKTFCEVLDDILFVN